MCFGIMGGSDDRSLCEREDPLMLVKVFADRTLLSKAAAEHAGNAIRRSISEQGHTRVVVASAASQIEFLEALTRTKGIDWSRVEVFHLDEYIGLPMAHPGSFRKMILEQLIYKTGITNYHLLDGDADDPAAVARAVGRALASAPVDIAFLGIGENGHIAFNDPPADFETEEPYIIVNLDEACRQQQVGEAWFANISQVPKQAISMSARQILKARELLAVVPDLRKAQAVRATCESEISPQVPASILREHENATVYLDKNSASLLSPEMRELGTHELPMTISR
ncbi:MAG TPA: glucosamine-6-phosphate deaminase [Terriglobales bacterium]|nr:glucosamine-6-phosphate deaminase [Terriglobales bacterium]